MSTADSHISDLVNRVAAIVCFRGPLRGVHVKGERRFHIVRAIDAALERGMDARTVCAALGVSVRRYRYWRAWEKGSSRPRLSARRRAPQQLFARVSVDDIRRFLSLKPYRGASFRTLAKILRRTHHVRVSHVTLWKIAKGAKT